MTEGKFFIFLSSHPSTLNSCLAPKIIKMPLLIEIDWAKAMAYIKILGGPKRELVGEIGSGKLGALRVQESNGEMFVLRLYFHRYFAVLDWWPLHFIRQVFRLNLRKINANFLSLNF